MAEAKRYRFTVPLADESVLEWCENQANLSFSLRTLVREYIAKHGMTDATCGEVVQAPRRGRPPKEDTESIETVISDTNVPVKEEVHVEAKPVVQQTPSVNTDEDGFVDPSDLF